MPFRLLKMVRSILFLYSGFAFSEDRTFACVPVTSYIAQISAISPLTLA